MIFRPPVAAVVVALVVAAAPLAAGAADDAPAGTEFGFVPLAGGDSDIGIGVGALATLARMEPEAKPFKWRAAMGGFISVKLEDGALVLPYIDASLTFTVNRFLDSDRLRFEIRPSFTREATQRYFGLGDASPAPDPVVPARDQYGRVHPSLQARLRVHLVDMWFWETGVSYAENWLSVDPTSTLAMQMASGSDTQRELLGTARQHGVIFFENAIMFDSRETDISPYRGHFHQLKLRYSPRFGEHFPYSYNQLNLTSRVYFVMLGSALRLDLRGVIDIQLGDVPFYELARYEDTFFGGANGLRGVPGQRYYGRVKAFGNVEFRSRWFGFDVGGKTFTIGSAAFFDFGRLWSDFGSHPELDGTGVGLKYGVGGGIRLQQGEQFIVRLDVAWSPDANPIGLYVQAGQAF
jgi:hypothetical protein